MSLLTFFISVYNTWASQVAEAAPEWWAATLGHQVKQANCILPGTELTVTSHILQKLKLIRAMSVYPTQGTVKST